MTATSSALPLMHAKLSLPRLIRDHVPRHGLLTQLTASTERSLTLLIAPAGSGKSTLLSEWLSSSTTPTAWVSLDERDNDVDVFLAYVIASVQAAVPSLTMQTRDLLWALTPVPPEELAIRLSNDLHRLATDLVLVLDDYHVISNPQIHEILGHVLRHPPANLHLVVATRAHPPWPLATLQAHGRMMALSFADLRFSPTESEAFLRARLGNGIPGELVNALHVIHEGWPAGLQLMTLVLNEPRSWDASVSNLPQTSDDVTEDLLAEVFSLQPLARQQDLLRLAILDWFTPALCAAVCGYGGTQVESTTRGQEVLNALERAGVFIVSLDARHGAHRFHHLFQHFLRKRLGAQCSSDEIAELHRRASEWFAREGQIDDALEHALAAGDSAHAAHLVAQHRHAMYNQEQFGRLARWLRRLPLDTINQSAELLMADARIATFNWQFPEAAVLLDRAERILTTWPQERQETDAARGELSVLRLMPALWSADPTRLQSGAVYALEVLPHEATHLRGHAHTAMAASLYLQGQLHHALAYLDEQLAGMTPRIPTYAGLLHPKAILHWLNGELAQVSVAAARLLRVSQNLDLPELSAVSHWLLGMTHYARNELAEAEQHLTKAVAAQFNLRLLWWCDAAGMLALTYQAMGRPHDARRTLVDAHEFVLERHALRVLPNVGAYQAELDRRLGRQTEAARWAGQVEPGPLAMAVPMFEPRLVQARVFLSQGTALGREYAAVHLGELRTFCERVPNRRLLIDVEALEALLHDRRGDEQAALATLTRVVEAALPEGWVRVFLDLGPPMANLLSRLALHYPEPKAIAQLLGAFATREVLSGDDSHMMIEPLSPREREILHALAVRDSNKEIAARLRIAPSTVQRHTVNLYQKLGVNSRHQAVVRAREMGLLPPA